MDLWTTVSQVLVKELIGMVYTLSPDKYARDKSKAELSLREGCPSKPIDGGVAKVDGFVGNWLPPLSEINQGDCMYSP